MRKINKYLEEQKSNNVPYVIHKHNPRNGSEHYDIRFLDVQNPKILHSFACPSNFLKTASIKTVVVKTREHDPRWLTLKSYRLEEIESGEVDIMMSTSRYFALKFNGRILSGNYKLFKIKNSKRDDYWLLVKSK